MTTDQRSIDRFQDQVWKLPSNGGDALIRRWRWKILYGRNWIRLYLLPRIGLLNLILLVIFHYTFFDKILIMYRDMVETIWLAACICLCFIIRVQLASMPVLVAMQDFGHSTWDLICTTHVTTREIFRKITRYVLYAGVLPSALILLIEIIALGPIFVFISGNFMSGSGSKFLDPWVFCLLIFTTTGIGLNLTAMSLIVGLLFRKPFWAIVGAVVPVIIVIVSGTYMFLDYVNEWTNSGTFGGRLFDFFVMLVLPELYLLQLYDSNMNGKISGPSSSNNTLLTLTLWQYIAAAILWSIFYWVLDRRRNFNR